MENPLATSDAFKNRIADLTIGELLRTPFQPVQVLRELGPYGRMLDLKPNISEAPDPEFLVRLLTGQTSHQAYVRQEAGRHYKNLENLVRGKNKVSPTTKRLLAAALGFSMEDLEKLASSAPEGPLIPRLLEIFLIVEELPMHVAKWFLEREVPCPWCGTNLLGDVNAWWSIHAPGMRASEYHLAERLLNALLGVGLLARLVLQERTELPLAHLGALANPSRYPIGNWLHEAQIAMSCHSLAELATAMQLRGGVGATLSYGRLKKWSAGQDVMPLEAGKAIVDACGQTKSGMRHLMEARAIALVTDFVAASIPTGASVVGRKVAREVVHARLEQLGNNLQVAIAAVAGKMPLRPVSPGQTVATPHQ